MDGYNELKLMTKYMSIYLNILHIGYKNIVGSSANVWDSLNQTVFSHIVQWQRES